MSNHLNPSDEGLEDILKSTGADMMNNETHEWILNMKPYLLGKKNWTACFPSDNFIPSHNKVLPSEAHTPHASVFGSKNQLTGESQR